MLNVHHKTFKFIFRCSSVSALSDWGLDGSIPEKDGDLFAILAGAVLEPRQLVLEALFLAANWPEDEVDLLHPYSAEVRNMLHNVMLRQQTRQCGNIGVGADV